MADPARVHNFIHDTNKPKRKRAYNVDVDFISKFYITIEFILGTNRITVIGNIRKYCKFLLIAYTLIVNFVILIATAHRIWFKHLHMLFLVNYIKFALCNILSFSLSRRLKYFFNELMKFDQRIGYDEKISRKSISIIIQLVVESSFCLIFLFVDGPEKTIRYYENVACVLPTKLFHAIELHFFSHLIGLISPRIRLITNYVKLSYHFDNKSSDARSDDMEFKKFKNQVKRQPFIEMGDLMDLYYIIIKAYNFLNSAIKWQLLILMTSTFCTTLGFTYELCMGIITGTVIHGFVLVNISYTLMELISIFTMGMFANQVCGEVHRLREIISSTLYEKQLDKPSRVAARAFKELTEAQDLTFTLFHMFNVDISLPFNFMSLFLTYLIILLQFDKIINPNT